MNKEDNLPKRNETNPYIMPQGFMEESRRQIYARTKTRKIARRKRIILWSSSVAAIAVLAFVIKGFMGTSASLDSSNDDAMLAYVTCLTDDQLDEEIELFDSDPFFTE